MKLICSLIFISFAMNAACQQSPDTISNHRLDNIIFTKVEIEPAYPGGQSAWMHYLVKKMRYPAEAQDGNIQGTVNLQFIVDTAGTVSKVEVIDGPKELYKESIRLIEQSGRWTPAIQNGYKVKAYKRQSISYRLG